MATISELIKKAGNFAKLSSKDKKEEVMGDISMEKIKEMAKNREIPGNTVEARIRQIIGSCVSYRITIDGKDPRELTQYPD
ncbi:MAG: hypothetical protein DRP06_01845 [Candidatus Aenigmatarchaeota archaeon]|nr:MAG: hypothetical protein DRP06_01845 [Candidatus Aenigmarchaeota archaeon]